jgi:predicted alpha/beta hydrolase family esterase
MLKIVLLVIFIPVCGLLLLYLLQEKIIFFPQKPSKDNRRRFAPHQYTLERNKVTLSGWFIRGHPSRERPLIVYYGGNAEEVSMNMLDLGRYHTDSFLFMCYRGYGDSQGKPGEKLLVADALFILDTVIKEEKIPPEHIVLMGRSLGSGVAVQVAGRRKVGGLILVTGFDSMVRVARKHYPIFPVGLLLKHRFDSVSLAPKIQTPALFLIAGSDEIIPRKSATHLARQWGGPARTVIVERASHNDIEGFAEYWQAINAFLDSRPQKRSGQ